MKKVLKFIKSFPFIVIFIIILILYLPGAFSSPPETDKRAVITSLAFDSKSEDEIEASVVMLTPIENATFNETDTVVSATADTVANALLTLTFSIGKNLGLAHAEIIIVGSDLAERNIAEVLNYIIKSTDISNNTPIVVAEGSAKEMLLTSHKISKNTRLKLQQIIVYNEEFLFSINTNLATFYKSYYNENFASLLALVKLKSVDEDVSINESFGQGQNGNSSDSESESSNGGSQSPKENNHLIDNDGSSVIIKNGKMVGVLDRIQTRGVNWIDKMSHIGSIDISGVNSEKLQNAKLLFAIRNKKVRKVTSFENNSPVINIAIHLSLNIEEINQDEKSKASVNAFTSYIDETVRLHIEQKIKQEFSSALQVLKDENADVINMYQLFYKNHKKEFTRFLESLENKENYLDYISFRVSVSCQEYK